MPAVCNSRSVSNRTESSRSLGTPSSCEADVSSCSGVARGFARCDKESIIGAMAETFVTGGFVVVALFPFLLLEEKRLSFVIYPEEETARGGRTKPIT